MLGAGPDPERVDVGVLEEKEVVLTAAVEQRVLEGERLPVTDASEGANPQRSGRARDGRHRVYSSASQSRVSMTLATSRTNEDA